MLCTAETDQKKKNSRKGSKRKETEVKTGAMIQLTELPEVQSSREAGGVTVNRVLSLPVNCFQPEGRTELIQTQRERQRAC